jgi:hypothetical protein
VELYNQYFLTGMNPEIFSTNLLKRLMCRPLLCVLMAGALASTASADTLYENDGSQIFTITPNNTPPNIHATNFLNNGQFQIDFTSETINPELFETWDTLNYTNNGLMVAESPFGVEVVDELFLSLTPGCGFQFDDRPTATSLHLPSSSFYNPGTIRCNSEIDLFEDFLLASTIGECVINATNIVSPGTIDMGADGLIQMTGNKVDLTRGTLVIEQSTQAGLSGIDYGVGTDTNKDWDPSIFLQPTIAISSDFNSQLFRKPGFDQMLVFPSTPYFEVSVLATNDILTRAVFISPNVGNSNVVQNIYFGGNPNPSLGPGFVTIEWAGSYVDPATGQSATNYLYLNDFYLRGANTNNPVVNGVPSNFTFTELAAPAFSVAPATSQFPVFDPGIVTNNYSYVDLDLIATSVATNSPSQNVTNYLAILPGRTQINASQELDLSLANISGANYLSINAPNQFDGSIGAQIFSPFSDINIGVTNGFMTVTNLLEPAIPTWNGTVQAWSSDWFFVDTNGVTNEFRVLLVNPALNPTTPTQIQDLKLHATNSVIISDTLNVLRTLSIDAQSLTLTTNGTASASPDGELNLLSSTVTFQSALPNLLYLTNNGAIRTLNLAQFIGNSNTAAITPGTPASTATAKLSEVGNAVPVKNATVTIGNQKYAFESKLTNATVNQVLIAKTFDGSLSNLIAAINHGSGFGVNYSSATVGSTQVTAGLLSSHAFTVTADMAGTAGNSIAIATSATDLTWNGQPHLVGGTNAVAAITNVSSSSIPYGTIINNGLISDQGSTIRVNDFENYGIFSSGFGSFLLQSLTTTLTNGSITAGNDVSITTGNLLVSNVVIQAGRSLTLTVTNSLTDGITPGSAVVTNGTLIGGNIWVVGTNSVGVGLNMTMLPTNANRGDLLGTTIINYAPAGKNVINTWAGKDFGVSTAGFTNNEAVGRLVLDSLATAASAPPHTLFTFKGTGVSNAIYADDLEFDDYATNRDGGGNVSSLSFNPNLVIYYARAVISGVDVSQKLDGKNNGHLRWVPTYTGIFSSTNLIYPDGSTNTFNAALAENPEIDSDGDGTPNASDTTPFFVPSEVNLNTYLTNANTTVAITWDTVPLATNCVLYTTNMLMTNWMVLTNFISPIPYPSPPTNVTVFDAVVSPPRFYKVRVNPWLTYPF